MVQHQTSQIGNVIQIQKSNTNALNKTNSINVNNIKSTKTNQQQAIKLVHQTIGGVGGSTNQSATIKHGNASVVKTITSTAISSMSNPITIQPKNQTKTPSYTVQTTRVQQHHQHHQPPPPSPQQQQQLQLQQQQQQQQSHKSQLTGVHSNISTHSR